jgi:hypothetical protein
VAVVLGITLDAGFDLEQEGVAVVGDIESGGPRRGLPGASFEQPAENIHADVAEGVACFRSRRPIEGGRA